MSVKNSCERTAKRAWIPLVCALSVLICSGSSGAAESRAAEPSSEPVLVSNISPEQAWQELMNWIIRNLLGGLNCGTETVPGDVPVAMEMVADCYMLSGLAEMTPEETAEFLLTVEEAMQLTKESPESVPQETREKLLTALRLMLAEMVVQ